MLAAGLETDFGVGLVAGRLLTTISGSVQRRKIMAVSAPPVKAAKCSILERVLARRASETLEGVSSSTRRVRACSDAVVEDV